MKRAAVARTVHRFDRNAEAGSPGESRIAKLTAGKVDEARGATLHRLGDGKLTFRMVAQIKHWQARARRRPVPKGKVFVEKLVHLVTWHAADYGPQTGPRVQVDPIKLRWTELNDADYANQVNETRKRVQQLRKDREFLETCYDLLDSNMDGKLAPVELEHWVGLLLADNADKLDTQKGALKYWVARNQCGRLTDAERLDLQIRLDKKRHSRDMLEYDWQDFLLVTLDFYTLAGTLAMHQTFCRLLEPDSDEVVSSFTDMRTSRRSLGQSRAAEPPLLALPRPPIKLTRRRCVVIQAGNWNRRVAGREVSRATDQRKPRRPLPPVPAEVLGSARLHQPLRPTPPVAILPSTPKQSLRVIRAPVTTSPAGGRGAAASAATANATPAGRPTQSRTVMLKDTKQMSSIGWSNYDVDSHGRVLGYVGPVMEKLVNKRVNSGVMPPGLRQLTVETARSARRVTQNIRVSRTEDRQEGTIMYGWDNNLPVVIIPGLCSSGLEVKKSDVNPIWEGERVWFSLEKLGQQRSATTRAAAKTVELAADVLTAPGKLVGKAITRGRRLSAEISGLQRKDSISQNNTGEHFIRFHLHRARDLIAGDADGQSDPVARVELINHDRKVVDKALSSIKTNTRNPFWDETFELGLHVQLDDIFAVRVSVLDDDGAFATRDNLGEITMELQQHLSNAGYRALPRAWHKLGDTRHQQQHGRFTDNFLSAIAHASGKVPADKQSKALFSGEIECWADIVPLHTESETSETDDDIAASSSDPATPGLQLSRSTSSVLMTENDDTTYRSRLTQVDANNLKGFDRKLWLRHMLLAPDAHSDPDGIEVRAVPGLNGVDYLQPGTVMKTTTWVFGPVIKFLKARGYDESNLKGAPYDWRMPPMYLEKRDGYFSELCKTIEDTYHDNGNKPVVLLAHSMGNNMAHYFSNWVLNNGDKVQQVKGATKPNGEAWLEKHVFSLFGIGGPYLGASETLRSCIAGDDFGMGPALLPAKEARRLCQAMGSGAWLLPAGRLAEHNSVSYDRVEQRTATSVKLGNGAVPGHYEPRSIDEALRLHGAKHVAEQKNQWYDRDSCMPGGSSMMPPPLKRVFHVYGTNLDTQVGFVFKEGEGTHELDTSVNFGEVDGMRYHNGIIWETSDTSQMTLRADSSRSDTDSAPEATYMRRVSGDGTVPYASLQHTLSWNSPQCLSQTVELDRAAHREILDDGRFHQVLGDYLCDTLVVYVIAARNLAPKDLLIQSSDPYCVVTLHTGPKDPQRRTKTHKRTLNPEFNEVFTFGAGELGEIASTSGDVLASARVISVEVRDSDFCGLTSDHIGKMALPIQTIIDSPNHAVNGWFKLMPECHVNDPDLASKASQLCHGEIFLQFELESAGQSYRGVPDHFDIVQENMLSYQRQTDVGVEHAHHHGRHRT